MRLVTAALTALVACGVAAPAAGEEAVDPATLASVLAAAAKGYVHPQAASVRNVHKSRATNGSGYCGEITLEPSSGEAGGYTVFHVLLETPTGPSVLRLSDFPGPEASPQAATVHQMLHNFGCTP